ncbi:MAG: helix-turn-helix transcriptional regulator [Planctomycetes bacterium]|nr:helix-turn-helix transcriptional regulator [Planctomycetota bacterium]
MDDLVFLHGGRSPRCTAVVDKHFDGYCSLQFMAAGAVDLFYDREHQRLDGRWCWTAFPGPWIRFRRAEGCSSWDHRYVAIRGSQVVRWLADGLLCKGAQPAPTEAGFATDFDRLLALTARPDRWGRRRAANLLENLLLALADARAAGTGADPWLERVTEAVSAPEPYSVARIARDAGMAVSTLRRRFRQATGTSMHAHALACRIAQARRMLDDGVLPIKAISERLGYSDVSFFTKQFTRHVGVSPGAYRLTRVMSPPLHLLTDPDPSRRPATG